MKTILRIGTIDSQGEEMEETTNLKEEDMQKNDGVEQEDTLNEDHLDACKEGRQRR